MKVALVVPKTKYVVHEVCVPLNLLYLATYLRQEIPEVEIKIIDGAMGCDVEGELFAFQPDIVGISATTPQASAAYALGDMLCRRRPDILSVIGGVHASALPDDAEKHFDVVVVGEGEQAFAEIVRVFMERKTYPHGIVQGKAVSDLNTLPFPAYDLVDMNVYFGSKTPTFQHLYLAEPLMQIMTSRGCVNHCPYCYNSVFKPKLRFFSAKRVVDELVFLHEKYGVNNFFIHDDEFLVNRKRILEIFELSKARGITDWLQFVCQARAQSLDSVDYLQTVKALGCKAVLVGFETHNKKNLDYMKHGSTTLYDHDLAVENAAKVGIPLTGSFIFGSPIESVEMMQETLEWMLKIKANTSFGFLVPFPCTEIYLTHVVPRGIKFDFDNVNITNRLLPSTILLNENVDREELKQFLDKASSLLRLKKRFNDHGLLRGLTFHVFWISLLRYPTETKLTFRSFLAQRRT